MKEEILTDALLREFLLGKVDDEERERIENLFLTDSQVKEKVLSAEQDLIEDYLEDSLTTADRERFLARYAQSSAQRRKLKITKSIKDFALTRPAVSKAVPSSVSIWARLRASLRPLFVIPIVVALIVAIVIVAVWLSSKMEQRNRHLALQQELERLNSPSSLREVSPQTVSKDLPPVTLRSGELQTEVKKGADVRFVELRLLSIRREDYSTYEAVVRRVESDESFTIPNLQAEDNAGKVIRMRLPADILTSGLYRIQLSGFAADGSRRAVDEYNFTVSD